MRAGLQRRRADQDEGRGPARLVLPRRAARRRPLVVVVVRVHLRRAACAVREPYGRAAGGRMTAARHRGRAGDKGLPFRRGFAASGHGLTWWR